MTASPPLWIAADWGTTALRVWAMRGDTPGETRSSAEGMGKLTPDQFEPALLRLIGDWLPPGQTTQVIACGMVGARQGWSEAAYRPTPCAPLGQPFHRARTTDPRLEVYILPGLCQPDPADVMRGEETQIAGFLARNPGWQGTLCLPGTHTKWACIAGGQIIRFQTCMTGEIFALLSTQSVLRHGIGQGFDDAAFDVAVTEALTHPEAIATKLFALRAMGLLHGLPPDAARARLSGLLIGLELAGTRDWWQGHPVALIGAGGLSALYSRALAAHGTHATAPDGAEITLAGLIAARTLLEGQA